MIFLVVLLLLLPALDEKYLITLVDAETQFIVTWTVPNRSDSDIIQFIKEKIISKEGSP